MRLAPQSAIFAAIALASGCHASAEGEVHAGNKAPAEVADFDKPLEQAAVEQQQKPTFEQPGQDAALLGARQDLTYKGPSTPRCKCLAVAVGQPGDPAFQWAGERPKTNRDSQLVIALSSNGVACAEATGGASYWGFEMMDGNVVVTVEPASPGRPVASGAIIPRPLGNGQVYVRSSSKKVPYGQPLGGSGDRCQVSALTPAAAPSATPVSGVRIHTPEPEPTSSRTERP